MFPIRVAASSRYPKSLIQSAHIRVSNLIDCTNNLGLGYLDLCIVLGPLLNLSHDLNEDLKHDSISTTIHKVKSTRTKK